MPISRVKDRAGRSRFEFEFSRRIGGRRLRSRKLLPASWTRTQADAFDRKRSAELYAQAAGIEVQQRTLDEAVARYLDERTPELKSGKGIAAELHALQDYYVGRPLLDLPDACAEILEDYRGELAPATGEEQAALPLRGGALGLETWPVRRPGPIRRRRLPGGVERAPGLHRPEGHAATGQGVPG